MACCSIAFSLHCNYSLQKRTRLNYKFVTASARVKWIAAFVLRMSCVTLRTMTYDWLFSSFSSVAIWLWRATLAVFFWPPVTLWSVTRCQRSQPVSFFIVFLVCRKFLSLDRYDSPQIGSDAEACLRVGHWGTSPPPLARRKIFCLCCLNSEKVGQLIRSKIAKTVASKCQILRQTSPNSISATDQPLASSYNAIPDLPAEFKGVGVTSKGNGKERERERKKMNGRRDGMAGGTAPPLYKILNPRHCR